MAMKCCQGVSLKRNTVTPLTTEAPLVFHLRTSALPLLRFLGNRFEGKCLSKRLTVDTHRSDHARTLARL